MTWQKGNYLYGGSHNGTTDLGQAHSPPAWVNEETSEHGLACSGSKVINQSVF